MICFDNSTPLKTLRDMSDFHAVNPMLVPRMAHADMVIEEITGGASHWTVTSIHRDDNGDHGKWNGIDGRAYGLTESNCLLLEKMVNERFPMPPGVRPTIRYWHPDNSTRLRCPAGHWKINPLKLDVIPTVCPKCGNTGLITTFYPRHFHLRVESHHGGTT